MAEMMVDTPILGLRWCALSLEKRRKMVAVPDVKTARDGPQRPFLTTYRALANMRATLSPLLRGTVGKASSHSPGNGPGNCFPGLVIR